jgi:hypothetical protein
VPTSIGGAQKIYTAIAVIEHVPRAMQVGHIMALPPTARLGMVVIVQYFYSFQYEKLSAAAQAAAVSHLGSTVASSRCTTAHPLHARFAKKVGASISEITMRPNPTMRMDLSGPLLESWTGKRESFPERAVPISPNAR